MADIYFPDVMAALPEPRFVEPQSNTGVMAMGSALQSLTSVANNFRTKEMNVQKAQQMADALEREGLTQEANLYRSASESYQTNFFATPQENERFNQSLLNDTLKLLTNKQEREMREQALRLDAEYKQSMINNMRRDDARADERLRFEKEELQERAGEKADALSQKEEATRLRNLGVASTQFNKQIAEINNQRESLLKQRKASIISKKEYEVSDGLLVDQLDNLNKQNDSINKMMLDAQNYEGPFFETPKGRINNIVTDAEQDAADEAEALRKFEASPLLETVVVNGKTYRKPRPTEINTTTGTDSQGRPINKVETKSFGKPAGMTAPSNLPAKKNVNQLNLN